MNPFKEEIEGGENPPVNPSMMNALDEFQALIDKFRMKGDGEMKPELEIKIETEKPEQEME